MIIKFSHQIFNRGTNHINDKKNEGSQIEGEILRLIQYNDKDEYLFNLHKTEHFGWNLGNSSPLYRGLYLNDNLQKYKPDVFIPVDYRNDYEFSFFIQTDKKITITFDVNDTNDAPTDISWASGGSVPENSAEKVVVGQLSAIDLNTGDELRFVRVENSKFNISTT